MGVLQAGSSGGRAEQGSQTQIPCCARREHIGAPSGDTYAGLALLRVDALRHDVIAAAVFECLGGGVFVFV